MTDEIKKYSDEIAKQLVLAYCKITKRNVPPSWETIESNDADNNTINFVMLCLTKFNRELIYALKDQYQLDANDIDSMLDTMNYWIIAPEGSNKI